MNKAVTGETGRLMGLVRAANTSFTAWLIRRSCATDDARMMHSLDATVDVDCLSALLECHGWSVARCADHTLVLERAAVLRSQRRAAAHALTKRMCALVEDVADQFTHWLLLQQHDALSDLFRCSVDIPRPTADESSRVQDVLECHGWAVDVRDVDGSRSRLSVERVVMPAAVRAGRVGDSVAAQVDIDIEHACVACKVPVAIKPTRLAACGHVFCLTCITSLPPNTGCIAQTSCPACGTHFYFHCMRRLDRLPVNRHLWNARMPEA